MIRQDPNGTPLCFRGPFGASADVLLVEDLSQQRLPARALAAVLCRAGWRAQLVDLNASTDLMKIVALARLAQPRLIISSILFADRLSDHLSLVTALRDAGVQAHISMTGPLPSFAFKELLADCPGLDSVLCGEAEATIVQLAAEARDPWRWQSLNGIASRSPDTRTLRADPLPETLPSLDGLPLPKYDDISTYLDYGFATVESSRGCYHNCTFCLPCAFYHRQGARYRMRGVTNLVDEIEHLYRRGARLFLFDDEQFLPPKRLRDEHITLLHDELEHRGIQIAFTIKCRADDIDRPLFERMKEMGLVRVYIGIESGSQASLDLFGKAVTPRRNTRALALLNELGIVADFRVLIFHPWSTLETIAADVAFLRNATAHVSTCFDFREVEVYPGTALARRLRAEGRGEGIPWLPSYVIQDPRSEMLRRLSRFIFGLASPYRRMQVDLARAWFGLLLERRFHPDRFEASRASGLKKTTEFLNRKTLEVWRELLSFASEVGDLDSEQVNARAEVWVSRINGACAQVEDPFTPAVA